MLRLRTLWSAIAVLGALSLFEAALVERKYGVFGGGFGAMQVVDRPAEWAAFGVAGLLAQALLVGALFLFVRALHGRRRDTWLARFNFLFFATGIGAGLLLIKYQVLSYFSDAIGFELMRNLGGGSLGEAVLYVADEAGLALAVALAAAVAWWIGWRVVRRLRPGPMEPPALRWRHLLWLVLPLPIALLAAHSLPDARHALSRFNAPALANAALARASDFDRDGHSWFTARVDRFPFDPARHPLALDIPGNAVDEDGLGGDFIFDGDTGALATPRLPERPPHLVLIVLESTRADAVGKRVGAREVTPVLNALSRDGSVAPAAYSHVGFTTASLKSLFSGALDPAVGSPSLFRDLNANGYRIAVLSAAPESFGDVSEVVGMKASADIFVDAELLKEERAYGSAAKSSLAIDGRKLLREFDRRLMDRAGWATPTFLYLNFQEAHFPYHHAGMMRLLPGDPIPRGEISAGNREWLERTYWNAVAYDDWLIGQVIERLKQLGVWGSTLLLVTADHGESLFDDDFLGHGHVINAQQTAVPLVLNRPGLAPEGPIGLAGYRRLILGALGAPVPEPKPRPVFQHIGGLDWPTEIGMVEPDGARTVMKLADETLRFGDGGSLRRYPELAPGSPERARADRLIQEWARQRWIAHLAREGQIAVRP